MTHQIPPFEVINRLLSAYYESLRIICLVSLMDFKVHKSLSKKFKANLGHQKSGIFSQEILYFVQKRVRERDCNRQKKRSNNKLVVRDNAHNYFLFITDPFTQIFLRACKFIYKHLYVSLVLWEILPIVSCIHLNP